MSLLRPFSATDLFRCVDLRRRSADSAASTTSSVPALSQLSPDGFSLDAWTETYSTQYYLQYLATWPDLFLVQEHPDGTLMGYGACGPSRAQLSFQ